MSENDNKDIDEPARLHLLLQKSQSIAEKLVKQNEQLKLQLAGAEERWRAAERERDALRNRISVTKEESSTSLTELQSIESELNTLANLHSANWQLHARLDLGKVLDAIMEICLNLIGADQVVIYLLDEDQKKLLPVRSHGVAAPSNISIGEGLVGKAAINDVVLIPEDGEHVAIVPFAFENRVVSILAIHHLLPHKDGLTPLDHELFTLMNRQGATALYGAYLAGVSDLKITEDGVRLIQSR